MSMITFNIVTDALGNGNATSEYIQGEIMKVGIVYDGAAAAATDITFFDGNIGPIVGTQFLQLLNNNVNGFWYPRVICTDEAGAPIFYDAAGAPGTEIRDRTYISGQILVDIAQAGGVTTNTVRVWIKEDKS